MKRTGRETSGSQTIESQDRLRTWKYNNSLVLSLLFLFSAIYFYSLGTYIFFYQENQSLFVYTGEYFHQFSEKPGGLLEYVGIFLTQGYFNFIYGSVILSAVFTLLAVIFLKIIIKLFPDSSFLLPFALLPSCFLFLAQNNYKWLMYNNIGFILVALAFLFSISSDKRFHRILAIVLFPLFYYFAGAYAWVFLGMYILHALLKKRIIDAISLMIAAALSMIIFKGLLFLQPFPDLLRYPLPSIEYFKRPVYLYLLFGFITFTPALLKVFSLIRIKNEYQRSIRNYSVLLIFALTFFSQLRIYDPNTADFFKIEKLFFEQDWDRVIKHQEKSQSANLLTQYYYNIALAEKDLLCERMFFSRHDFGTQSIMIPWDHDKSISMIFRGVYFFYTIGLINEAHRWAYESMVIQGYIPENIKLLIKTELINGHYKIAEKYINILKRTLHYRSWARKYELMLYHPDLVKSDPELGTKISLQPKADFLIILKNPQINILFLLQANPQNRKAFEYMMAWLMLEKNIVGVVGEISKLQGLGYTRIPRHIEEAVLFFNANIGVTPELSGFRISPESKSRFLKYESSIRYLDKNKATRNSEIEKSLRNTLWYYLDSKRVVR